VKSEFVAKIVKPCLPITFLFILFLSATSYSQRPVYTSEQHLGIEDGLPQSFVTGFAQDKDGFIWISTIDGLSRFDGREFKNFRSRPGDSTTLERNAIFKIFSQRDSSKLTVTYEGGSHGCFDTRTFQTKPISHLENLEDIPNSSAHFLNRAATYNGVDWLFPASEGQGIGWKNTTSGETFFANTKNGLLKQDTLSVIFQTPNGSVFLISEDGVQVGDSTKKHFSFLRFPTSIGRFSPDMFLSGNINAGAAALLLDGRLLVYRNNRVVILDLRRKTSTAINIPLVNKYHGESHKDLLCQDSRGVVYLVNHGRVFRVNHREEMELIWENRIEPQANITALMVDRSDVLWVSINTRGITKIDLCAPPFRSYAYRNGFVADVLEEAGVSSDQIPASWKYPGAAYRFRQAWASESKVYLSSSLWSQGEIFSYQGDKFSRIKHQPSSRIYTALVAKGESLYAFDERTSTWFVWETPDSIPDSLSLGKSDLTGGEITDGYSTKAGFWLPTYNTGLLLYQRAKRLGQFGGGQSEGHAYIPRELTEICPDPDDENLLWIGSRGYGLILWDIRSGLQKIFTVDDGLSNNTVYCISPDKSGNLWCSTNKGIFRFNPKTHTIHSFAHSDGLQGNEFNRAHKFRFFDGRLAFGGTEGYTLFDPSDFDDEFREIPVPIQLTGLQINNKQQHPSDQESIIRDPLSLIKEISLPFDQNNLRFEFAALLFNQPGKTNYRFQMVGIDHQWVENGTSNVASYLGLSPGTYKLLVNATDYRGGWSDDFKEIRIVIRPPFWATFWAGLFYALVLTLIVWRYLAFKEEQLNARQNLAFEKREAARLKELDEVKDRFFSNIAHEFRTPLTLIITPLQKLLSEQTLSGTLKQTLQRIEKNSRQLLSLINEFLDFSKVSSGQMQINNSAGDLALFVSSCVESFDTIASEKQISLSFASDGVEGTYLFDNEKWRKILFNLLGNALKFTSEEGMVSVRLKHISEDRILLQVWDNGAGITEDDQQRIFERFYQVDGSAIRTHGGTGIGLALVKEMAELLGGTIRVESELRKFSLFSVELPVGRENAPESHELATELPRFQPEGDRPQLVIVEDNSELRAFMAASLEKVYAVSCAPDGVTGWELIRTTLPDLVISDVMMPGMDGFDLCGLCKTDPLTAHVGFILLTSKAAHEARLKGLQSGADDYVTKPFQWDELELRIQNLFRLQQSVRLRFRTELLTNPPEVNLRFQDPFLARLHEEIDARLTDPDLLVEDLCRALSVSKSTLNRKLKALLDVSATELIRQCRLEKAASLLRAGMDIASVAYNVGFGSPSYFTHCFRERYRVTPTE
jgi:signal transduction histidine kinase/DNA-binding response OmpR family regulator